MRRIRNIKPPCADSTGNLRPTLNQMAGEGGTGDSVERIPAPFVGVGSGANCKAWICNTAGDDDMRAFIEGFFDGSAPKVGISGVVATCGVAGEYVVTGDDGYFFWLE